MAIVPGRRTRGRNTGDPKNGGQRTERERERERERETKIAGERGTLLKLAKEREGRKSERRVGEGVTERDVRRGEKERKREGRNRDGKTCWWKRDVAKGVSLAEEGRERGRGPRGMKAMPREVVGVANVTSPA